MYSLLHCLFFFFFLRQASNAHVTPRKTWFRGTASGGLQSNTTEAEQCPGSGWLSHKPTWMPLGDLHHPEALQFWEREGRARPAKAGPLVRRYFLIEEEEAEKWMSDYIYIYSSIFNSFLSKGKEKNWFKKKKPTTTLELGLCIQEAGRKTHSV